MENFETLYLCGFAAHKWGVHVLTMANHQVSCIWQKPQPVAMVKISFLWFVCMCQHFMPSRTGFAIVFSSTGILEGPFLIGFCVVRLAKF